MLKHENVLGYGMQGWTDIYEVEGEYMGYYG